MPVPDHIRKITNSFPSYVQFTIMFLFIACHFYDMKPDKNGLKEVYDYGKEYIDPFLVSIGITLFHREVRRSRGTTIPKNLLLNKTENEMKAIIYDLLDHKSIQMKFQESFWGKVSLGALLISNVITTGFLPKVFWLLMVSHFWMIFPQGEILNFHNIQLVGSRGANTFLKSSDFDFAVVYRIEYGNRSKQTQLAIWKKLLKQEMRLFYDFLFCSKQVNHFGFLSKCSKKIAMIPLDNVDISFAIEPPNRVELKPAIGLLKTRVDGITSFNLISTAFIKQYEMLHERIKDIKEKEKNLPSCDRKSGWAISLTEIFRQENPHLDSLGDMQIEFTSVKRHGDDYFINAQYVHKLRRFECEKGIRDPYYNHFVK